MQQFLDTLGKSISSNLTTIGQITIVLVVAIFLLRIVRLATRRFERKWLTEHVEPQQQSRFRTLLRAGNSVLQVVIVIIAGMMILSALGIDMAPLLASVGIAGLAVSLGAQTLIKDFIGGALILLENQFNVGDVIQVGAVTGTVEEVTMRTTNVRDGQGKLFIIPNGDVRTLSNNSRNWNLAVVDLNLPQDTNILQATQVLENAIARIKENQDYQSTLLSEPQVQGWNAITDWAVQVRLSVKTTPNAAIDVTVLLRRYALDALNEAGIHLAIPPQYNKSV
jgi:small conductance mechanosensitive channel